MAKKRILRTGASDEEVELNGEALEGNEEENEELNGEGSEEGEEENENGEGGEGEDSDEIVEEAIKEEELNDPAPKPETEKIRIKSDLSCHIGGVFHRFHAGKEYFVDANVKSILKASGYLEAL